MISNLIACGRLGWLCCSITALRLSSVTPWAGIQVGGDALAHAMDRDIRISSKFRDHGTCWLSDTDALKEENDRFSSANYQLSLKAKRASPSSL